jgi:hypothetical protein
MIITTSMPALVLALVTSGAIPAPQVQAQAPQQGFIGSVTAAEPVHTDTPWIEGKTLIAVGPAPGYLENLEAERKAREAREARGDKCSA